MSVRHTLRYLSTGVGLIGILGASLSGCGGGSTPSTGGNNTRAACQPNTHVSGRARWTILIYMNAANNLQPDSLLNVSQLASTGSDANVNLVIQWKQAQCVDCGSPSFFGTRRYLIHAHSVTEVAAIRGGDTTSLDPD